MTARPRISIVTPSFNQGEFIERVRFHAIDQWLATCLRHPRAKTRAQRSEMYAEAMIVIIKVGGEAAVRPRLTMMKVSDGRNSKSQ